jgi:large subunit ribosomal protein L22
MKSETKAKLRYLRMSARKVRLLIGLIRGMKVEEALMQLEVSKKDAAGPVFKLLKSAIANAKNNNFMKEETLVIKQAFVDGGPILYRWKPRAFGRSAPIRKRTSHVTIVLEGEVDEKHEKQVAKNIKSSEPVAVEPEADKKEATKVVKETKKETKREKKVKKNN